MFKKIAKFWIGYVLGSCFLYVYSDSMLNFLEVDSEHKNGNEDAQFYIRPIIMVAIDNFKKAIKIMYN